MVQLTGDVGQNLHGISKIAAGNQNANIRITREASGGNVVVKPVEIKQGWVAWFLSLFGYHVSQEDTSGSSEHLISAFEHNYGEVGKVAIDECGIKGGRSLMGRDVVHAMHRADELLKEKSWPLDQFGLLDEPMFQDVAKRMGVSLERVRDAYVKVLKAEGENYGEDVSVYDMGKQKHRGFLIQAFKNLQGKCSYGEALLERIGSLDGRDFAREPLLPSEYKEMLAMAIKENRSDTSKKEVVERLERQLTDFSAFMRYVTESKPDWESDRANLRLGANRSVFQAACVESFLKRNASEPVNFSTLQDKAYSIAESRV